MSKGSPSRSLLRSLIERFQRVSISELYRVALVLWMPNQTYREGQECSHVIYKTSRTPRTANSCPGQCWSSRPAKSTHHMRSLTFLSTISMAYGYRVVG